MSGGAALSKEPQARPEALKTTAADRSPPTNNDFQQLALSPRKPTLSELFGGSPTALLVPERAMPFTTPRAGATQTFEQLATQHSPTRLVQFQRAFSPEPASRASSTMLLPKGGGMMNPPASASRTFLNRATLAGCDFIPERLPPRLQQLHLNARLERGAEKPHSTPRSVQSLLELYRPLEESNPRVYVANVAEKLPTQPPMGTTLHQLHGSVLIVDHPVANTRPLRTIFIDRQEQLARLHETHTAAMVPAETIASLGIIREAVSLCRTTPHQVLADEAKRSLAPYVRSSSTFLSSAARLAASLLDRSCRGECLQEPRITRLERLISRVERGAGRPPASRSASERDVALLGRVALRDERILSGFEKVAGHCQRQIERVLSEATTLQPPSQQLERLPASALQAVLTVRHYAHQLSQVRLAPASRQAVALQRLSEQLCQASTLRPVDVALITERLTRMGLLLTLRNVRSALRKEAETVKVNTTSAATILNALCTQMQNLHTLHLTHFMSVNSVRRPNAALRQLLKSNIPELQRLLNQRELLSAVTVEAFEELLDELTLLN